MHLPVQSKTTNLLCSTNRIHGQKRNTDKDRSTINPFYLRINDAKISSSFLKYWKDKHRGRKRKRKENGEETIKKEREGREEKRRSQCRFNTFVK